MFEGAITAMVTPFRRGEVDEARLRQNVAFQIDRGINGLVPVGTTGESPTLSHAEHRRVIELVVDQAEGRVPVIAGAGSNSTAEALELTEHARKVGAAASLQVIPYYNKPTQEGLYRHFLTIADNVDLPMVVYNIPTRCVVKLSVETMARLAVHPNVVAVKEATEDVDFASELAHACDITIISGSDSLTLPLMAIGGRGVISVLSNLVPERVTALTSAALDGRWDEARKLHLELMPLFKGMFIETNPIPIKTAMQMADMDSGEVRLPMCEMAAANRATLETLLRDHGIVA